MPTRNRVHISIFGDDTAYLIICQNALEASQYLLDHILFLEKWLKNCRIEVNEQNVLT